MFTGKMNTVLRKRASRIFLAMALLTLHLIMAAMGNIAQGAANMARYKSP